MNKVFKMENNKTTQLFKSDWYSKTICYDCKYIFGEFSSHITCPKCGSQSTSIKSIRKVYKRKWFVFKELIEIEIK
jgi:rRNA maturation endonuclease Nob1